MNKQKARSLFMDYIYEEISEDQKNELEAFLAEHPDLKDEVEELRMTRAILRNVPMVESAHRLVVVKPERGRFLQWCRDAIEILLPEKAFARTSFAIAAVLLAGFLLASVAKLQISATNEGWIIAFGAEPVPAIVQQGVDEETLNEIITLMRQENLLLASTLMEETQQQNEAQLSEAVSAILGYMEQQRRRDLLLVGRGLAEIEEENYYRYIQTNEALGELLYAINQQQ